MLKTLCNISYLLYIKRIVRITFRLRYSPCSTVMFKNVYMVHVWPFQQLTGAAMTTMKCSRVNERACTVRISHSKWSDWLTLGATSNRSPASTWRHETVLYTVVHASFRSDLGWLLKWAKRGNFRRVLAARAPFGCERSRVVVFPLVETSRRKLNYSYKSSFES